MAGVVCFTGMTANYARLREVYTNPGSEVAKKFYERLAGAYTVEDVAACPAHWLSDDPEPGGRVCPNGVTRVAQFQLWDLCRMREGWRGVEWGIGVTAGLILTNRFSRFISVEHDPTLAEAFNTLHAENVTALFPAWELRHVPLEAGNASSLQGRDYANVDLGESSGYNWVVVGPTARELVLHRALGIMDSSGAVLVIPSTTKAEATALESMLPKQWARAYTGADDAGTLVAMSCNRGSCPEKT